MHPRRCFRFSIYNEELRFEHGMYMFLEHGWSCVERVAHVQNHSTLNPKPLNLNPETLNPKPSTSRNGMSGQQWQVSWKSGAPGTGTYPALRTRRYKLCMIGATMRNNQCIKHAPEKLQSVDHKMLGTVCTALRLETDGLFESCTSSYGFCQRA